MRKKNIKIQLHQRIDDKLAIGVSRHKIKQMTNSNTSQFIHSIGTAESYRQTINEFSNWLKNEQNDIWITKDLDSINKDIAYKYLQERQEKGLSAWTVTKDMSALNKILDLGLTKKEGNLSNRSLCDITRSREHKEYNNSFNENNYKEQIDIARAFGLRRESIQGGNYAVKESSFFMKDNNIYVSAIEKGGRYRETVCLDVYKDIISSRYDIQERDSYTKEQFIEHYVTDKSDLLFDSYTSKIDNHSFRAEYATQLYNQLSEQKEVLKDDYKGYDSDILRQVSENLGHSRLDVVVNHYLR